MDEWSTRLLLKAIRESADEERRLYEMARVGQLMEFERSSDGLRRHQRMLRQVLKHAHSSAALTIPDILNWHEILMGDHICAGRGRTQRVKMSPHKPIDSPFVPLPDRKCENDCDLGKLITAMTVEWLDTFNDFMEGGWSGNFWHDLAYLHWWFESIHPFADGNGRTGRAILIWAIFRKYGLYLLLQESDREGYIDALFCQDHTKLGDLLARRSL